MKVHTWVRSALWRVRVQLKKDTVLELGEILKSEFEYELEYKDLEKLAYSLVGYFDKLIQIQTRHGFGNSPVRVIDSENKDGLDKRKEMN